MDKLNVFKEVYNTSLIACGDERKNFEDWWEQYKGTKEIPSTGHTKAADALIVWNFTAELVETQIDSYIPQPKVEPRISSPENKELALTIEEMLKSEMNRMPMEGFNDEDERVVKTKGGSVYLVEWDNTKKTHNTVGEVSARLIDPLQFIPEEAIYRLQYMDYMFVTYEDTQSRIENMFNVSVEDESIDLQTAETSTNERIKTLVVCYYINDDGGLGCFAWVGNTVVIDDDNYEARKDEVCAKCGKTRPMGAAECTCGSDEWETRNSEYEIVKEDIVLSNRIIPAQSQKREKGQPVVESYEELVPDGLGGFISETQHRAAMEPTKIPYYYPRCLPIVIRKNVSVYGKLLGDSDCEAVRDFQIACNKQLSKASVKLLKGGSYLTKPASLGVTLSDEDVVPINIDAPDQMAMLKAVTMNFETSQDFDAVMRYYNMARSVLGITDTFQGKADPTAESGAAKQVQIAQAAGRQRSKQVMKNAAYAQLYEMIFKYMLAYADEPRHYSSINEAGEQTERIFNRYDFLRQDEAGNWYYEDGFLFSIDENGANMSNRQAILEDLRTDFGIGAYGDPADKRTQLKYWQVKAGLNYPNAKQMVQQLSKEVQEQQQMMQQQGIQQDQQAVPEQQIAGEPTEQDIRNAVNELKQYMKSGMPEQEVVQLIAELQIDGQLKDIITQQLGIDASKYEGGQNESMPNMPPVNPAI